jgi:hypothetical protein
MNDISFIPFSSTAIRNLHGKHYCSLHSSSVPMIQSPAGTGTGTGTRRSILPSTYNIKEKKKKSLRSSFSPYARVLAIESHRDLSDDEKNLIWWQKCDYDTFRRTTSVVVRSMLNETTSGWLVAAAAPKGGDQQDGSANTSTTVSKPPHIPRNRNPSPPKRQLPPNSLAEEQENLRHVKQRAKTEPKKDDVQAHSWWNRFGDLACFHESRRRQTHAKSSIRVVLDEQSRQRMFNSRDPTKIRLSYSQATAWARDWARALATATADEVNRNFNDASYKEATISALYAMKEALTSVVEKSASSDTTVMNRLDANTSSQIRFRQGSVGQQQNTKATPSLPNKQLVDDSSSWTDSIIDDDDDDTSDFDCDLALAKKAVGFGANDSPNAVVSPLTS